MKLSEKYLNKCQPCCMECGQLGHDQVVRYGEYCRLEGKQMYGSSHIIVEAYNKLNEMAKEDNI